jgi:hypothetical protein
VRPNWSNVPKPPANWKKLHAAALKSQARAKKLIDQARRAMQDRMVKNADNTSPAADRERAALEAALLELWKAENISRPLD